MSGLESAARQTTVPCSCTRTIRPDVAERADSLLRRNGHLFHQNLSCDYCAGVLTLRGCVSRYYLKQVAQAVVASLDEVVQIENQIDVVASDR